MSDADPTAASGSRRAGDKQSGEQVPERAVPAGVAACERRVAEARRRLANLPESDPAFETQREFNERLLATGRLMKAEREYETAKAATGGNAKLCQPTGGEGVA